MGDFPITESRSSETLPQPGQAVPAMCGSVVHVSVCAQEGEDTKECARSVARLLGHCSDIRLVLVGESTANYGSEQPSAGVLQSAAEFLPA